MNDPKQPDALRLADELDKFPEFRDLDQSSAATELRRQHAEIVELRAKLEELEKQRPAAVVELEPNYSEMSREALERHAARMAQMLADDKPRKFWEKYASGPMSAPSCLCCGQIPVVVAIKHAELPGIVVCQRCRDAAAVAGPSDWRELAAKVMDALADAQEQTNAAYPAHVSCYPEWETQARWLRWHAEMFRTGKPSGNGAGQPAVLAALAAAPTTQPTPATQVDANRKG